jgi:hypothetical protein
MRADVLQAVAICCHGNPFLAQGENGAPELFGHNRAFGGVEEVTFDRTPAAFSRKGSTIPVATGTAPWMRRLAHEGTLRLELRLSRCAYEPAKREPGSWGILTDSDVGLEIWQPVWKARVVSYGERPVWKVKYTSTRTQRWSLGNTVHVQPASEMLASALVEANAFCKDAGTPTMRLAIDRCSDLHREGRLEMPGFEDLTAEPLPDPNQALLASAVRCVLVLGSPAWDRSAIAEHDQCRLELTSQLLWKCSLTAFESAVNTWAPSVQALKRAG